jgi:hypothetical protein
MKEEGAAVPALRSTLLSVSTLMVAGSKLAHVLGLYMSVRILDIISQHPNAITRLPRTSLIPPSCERRDN